MVELTQKIVRELFDYRDGELYWKVPRGNGVKIGDIAGHSRKDGYREISINNKHYLAHRLIFLWYYGYTPEFLDHIDGNKSNNSIDNLRGATNQQNAMNQKKQVSYGGKPTSSIYKGVHRDKEREKWRGSIQIDGKLKQLGRYDSEIEAAESYDKAATETRGEFRNLNFDTI